MTCKCKNELFLVKFDIIDYYGECSEKQFRLVSAENIWEAEDKIKKKFSRARKTSDDRDCSEVYVENIEVFDTVE